MDLIIHHTNQTQKFDKISNIVVAEPQKGQFFFDDLSAQTIDLFDKCNLTINFLNQEKTTINLDRISLVLRKKQQHNICEITDLNINDI